MPRSFRSVLLAACFGLCALSVTSVSAQTTALPDYVTEQFGTPPTIPEGPLSDAMLQAVDTVFIDSLEQSSWGRDQELALAEIAGSGDLRLAWVISDMMRFTWRSEFDDALADAAATLMGKPLQTPERWGEITDHLIAWDVPSYPGYLTAKRAIFTQFVPGWDKIFVEGDIDWRLVSWGGVLIDDRAYDTTDTPCNCIPAADNPQVVAASEATWPAEDAIVFGVVVNA